MKITVEVQRFVQEVVAPEMIRLANDKETEVMMDINKAIELTNIMESLEWKRILAERNQFAEQLNKAEKRMNSHMNELVKLQKQVIEGELLLKKWSTTSGVDPRQHWIEQETIEYLNKQKRRRVKYLDVDPESPSNHNETDDYVAWLCFRHRTTNQQPYLVICDSDTPGAFKVYRHPVRETTKSES